MRPEGAYGGDGRQVDLRAEGGLGRAGEAVVLTGGDHDLVLHLVRPAGGHHLEVGAVDEVVNVQLLSLRGLFPLAFACRGGGGRRRSGQRA